MSQGQRNRIALISALMNNPDVLILDESTNGLDTQTLLRPAAPSLRPLPSAAGCT